MRPSTRRSVLLLLAAILASVSVFAAVQRYVTDVESRLGPTRAVLVVQRALPALAAVTADDLAVLQVPQRWVPDSVVGSAADLDGLVLAVPVAAGTTLDRAVLRRPPDLRRGERGVSVDLADQPGAGYGVDAQDRVDVLVVRDGTARVVAAAVLVLFVGANSDGSAPFATLALTPQQAAEVAAGSEGATLRLAVVSDAETESLRSRQP